MNHKVDKKYEKFVFKTMAGSKLEFKKRWESIIESICNTINPNMVTNVLIFSDEIEINGRTVIMEDILGGDADVRLEDIIEFKTLLKRFKNIRKFFVDDIIFQRAIELYDDPVAMFFEYSKSLQSVYIVGKNPLQINRSAYIDNNITRHQRNQEIR